MRIAVIGDYQSPEYKELLRRIRVLKPEEQVLDLSVHLKSSRIKMPEARLVDIKSSHQIVISGNWDNHADAKSDIVYAQSLGKECFIDRDGQFLPFPEYAGRI